MIEFLGVGVPSANDGWLLHRVCVRLTVGQVVVVVAQRPEESAAVLDAATGRVIPTEGRVWVSRRPLGKSHVGEIRARVGEVDLSARLAEGRSVIWNTLATGPFGTVASLLRFPRMARRRAAFDALARVELGERALE